jgi:hypothetical protein
VNRRFILRVEHEGRVSFRVVVGHREAVAMARLYDIQDPSDRVEVLDASGRTIWGVGRDSAA